jgi:uncharacterized protein with von Willebrand factor type A (vWA) domain
VRLKADMSKYEEYQIPPHFTNIQHGLTTARRLLATQDTPNKQVILITDGLPTAHFEGQILKMLYPESTKGRVFFTAGKDLDRYVLWDYLSRRRELLH